MRSNPADYELLAPANLKSILSILADEPGSWRPIAGGTDLMVQYAAGNLAARKLVSIWGLRELRHIDVLPDEVRIGAGSTYTDLRANAIIESELDGRDCKPESRNHRRQYHQCLAGSRFPACTACVQGRIDSCFSSR
jgi:hypothetical protein